MADTTRLMALAMELATRSLLITSPNPRVGCVIANNHGQILGQGRTQKAGGLHAEADALQDALKQGHSVLGATAYVTLEPCSHQGRTGPCCDALISAGIKKVVASITDPNHLVAGKGFDRLRAAGIEVEIGLAAAESRELNLGFFSRMLRKTPWVRMKVAASLDGKTALSNGNSQWITSDVARTDGHAWRARACAVLTGIGTVLEDNPRLDVRLISTERQPALVVVDSRLEIPLDALLLTVNRACYIYTAVRNKTKEEALQAKGVTIVTLPEANGKVDLVAMLRDLAQREINELHVEAGERLNGSLIRENLVDEFVVYLAPKLIGQGRGMASFGPLDNLAQALPLEFLSCDRLGPDLRVVARVSGHDHF
jgi:diaminohydroxyphosphoribosylaminopyrimidine deaminase / 5-amino-6-(5-phosphoribosylamino)uracil reductase